MLTGAQSPAHNLSIKAGFVWERVRECMTIWGQEYKTRLSKVPSLCSRQSQHSDVPVLHLRSPVVSDLWTCPPSRTPLWLFQWIFALQGSENLGYIAIHGNFWKFLWSNCLLHIDWKRRISWLTCTFITESEGKAGGTKEWFVCNLNLIYSNLVMAEMDSRVLYGPCLVALLNSQSQIQGHW